MEINWDLYNKRLNVNGTTKRERDLQSLQNTLTNKLPDSPSYKAVKINDIDASIEMVKTTKDYIKVIHSLPNASFDCGDYVIYNDETYLITDIDADDEVYTSGKMQLCTYTIKFQSPTGTILSYPCIEESSNMAIGIDESNIINTLNGIKRIKLPFDDNTKLITVDNRFFITKGGIATFAVTNVNDTEFNYGDKGLIVLTMKASALQTNDGELPKDRPDLGICNYFEPTVEPEPPVEGYSYATVVSSGELTVGGLTRTITPTFYESDSTLADGIVAVWDIVLPTGYENQFTITYVDNQVKIKVAENYDLIEKTVTFNVMGSNGGYGGSLTLMITV